MAAIPPKRTPSTLHRWIGRGEPTALTLASGVSFFIGGVIILTGAATVPFVNTPGQLIGIFSGLAGLALVLLGLMARSNPDLRFSVGTVVILISTVGVLLGGGFLVGTILGILGGLLMILLPPWSEVVASNSGRV